MFIYNKDNKALLEVALGNQPADMIIQNGTLMEVHTGQVIPGRSVAVYGEWIAYVGPDAAHTVGEDTRIIDAQGRLLAPGYINVHAHIDNYCELTELLTHALGGGTTTFISETQTYGIAAGADGVRIFLDQARRQPVKIFCLVPPMVSLSPALASRAITPVQIEELLKEEEVVGLGESYWQSAILTPDDRVRSLIRETLKAGKSVQGHSAGASDRKLAAYGAAGVLSCHESVSANDVLERVEMGFFTIVREGHIRKDLESLRPLIGLIDFRRCALCTDGFDPEDLPAQGYFVDVIQKAVNMGIPTMDLLRMVTLNPAEHLGLSHLIGALAPGRFADILILPEPGIMMPDQVFAKGRLVAEAGRPVVPLPRHSLPERIFNKMLVPSVRASDFRVPWPESGSDKIRTINIQANGLVTREGLVTVEGGQKHLEADPEKDILKVLFIESVSGKGEKFVGFVKGWGQITGAVAASLCWDAAGIIAVGANDDDLALAVNQVIEMQGGVALAVQGETEHHIPYPIGGYISDMPLDALNRQNAAVREALHRLGVPHPSPLLSLVVLTSPAIPFIRITEKGYFRFRENDYLGV